MKQAVNWNSLYIEIMQKTEIKLPKTQVQFLAPKVPQLKRAPLSKTVSMKNTVLAIVLFSLLLSCQQQTSADTEDVSQTLHYYDAAIKKAPANYQLYLDRSNYYQSLGKMDKALADMSKAVS